MCTTLWFRTKTKILYGEVVEIANEPTRTSCANWFLRCTFKLSPGVPKNAQINIRSLKYATLPEGTTNTNDPPLQHASVPTTDIRPEPTVDPIEPKNLAPVQEEAL